MPYWHHGDLPPWVRRGRTMQAAAEQCIKDHCYDGVFFSSLDNEDCRRYLMFHDGVVLDRVTMLPCRLPEDLLVSCTFLIYIFKCVRTTSSPSTVALTTLTQR